MQEEEEEEEKGIVSSPGCIPKINFKKVPGGETLLQRSVYRLANERRASDAKGAFLWGRGGGEEARRGEVVLAYGEREERGVIRGEQGEMKLRVSQTF